MSTRQAEYTEMTARPFLAQVGLILFWPGLAAWAVWLLNVTGAL